MTHIFAKVFQRYFGTSPTKIRATSVYSIDRQAPQDRKSG